MIRCALVEVDDFHVCGTRPGPPETDTKLIIDPDAVLPFPVGLKRFQAVAGWNPQVIESSGDLTLAKFATCDALDASEPPAATSSCQRLGVRIAERDDHAD